MEYEPDQETQAFLRELREAQELLNASKDQEMEALLKGDPNLEKKAQQNKAVAQQRMRTKLDNQ